MFFLLKKKKNPSDLMVFEEQPKQKAQENIF